MTILILGEYLSYKDNGEPFRDGNGKMFRALLHKAGIQPNKCKWKLVFPFTPKGGFRALVGPKKEGIPNLKPVGTKYVKAELFPQVELLWKYINKLQPTLIIAVGDLAMWATTSESSIKANRGRITPSHAGIPGLKVIPVYHPRAVQAEYKLRPILNADLAKAKAESLFRGLVRPQRFIHIAPTLEDMEDFSNEFITPCTHLSVDIEVKGYEGKHPFIACVGFAPTTDRALVVPFYSEARKSKNFWRTTRSELQAWAFIRRTLRMGKLVGGQNYQYDTQYLWRKMGIKNPDFCWDTMLMHHAMQPEMEKGLGFLASLYTMEVAWKFMHHNKSADKTVKRGD